MRTEWEKEVLFAIFEILYEQKQITKEEHRRLKLLVNEEEY